MTLEDLKSPISVISGALLAVVHSVTGLLSPILGFIDQAGVFIYDMANMWFPVVSVSTLTIGDRLPSVPKGTINFVIIAAGSLYVLILSHKMIVKWRSRK